MYLRQVSRAMLQILSDTSIRIAYIKLEVNLIMLVRVVKYSL